MIYGTEISGGLIPLRMRKATYSKILIIPNWERNQLVLPFQYRKLKRSNTVGYLALPLMDVPLSIADKHC